MLDIDNGEKSDVECPGFENELQVYREKGRKRWMESYRSEQISRKVSLKVLIAPNMHFH